jgi:hypothetical protein
VKVTAVPFLIVSVEGWKAPATKLTPTLETVGGVVVAVMGIVVMMVVAGDVMVVVMMLVVAGDVMVVVMMLVVAGDMMVVVTTLVVVVAHAVANNTMHRAATVKIDQVPCFMFVPPNSYRLVVHFVPETLNMHNIPALIMTNM